MKGKRSSFLAFICSLLPGAGEMYLGFMKRGLSIMVVFWGLIFLAAWLGLGTLLFGMPIIWFYSFFDVHNLRAMPDDQFYQAVDDYILLPDINSNRFKNIQTKYRNIFALVLIIIGFTVLWNNSYDLVRDLLPDSVRHFIYAVGHYLPQLVIGCAIIALGLYLIRGKKKELDMEEKLSLIEDKGGKA